MKKKILISLIILSMCVSNLLFAQEIPTTPGDKISLDIKGMDIVDVLKMLSVRSGMNFVIGKNVTGRVNLFLKDVDLWDAFEIILLANELAYDRKGNIINVMTQRDYELIYGERFQDKKYAKIVQLKYAKAADLSRSLNQIKTNVGRIVADEASNTLVLIDSPDVVRKMEEFIQTTDLPLETKVFNLNYAQAEKLQPKLQEAITKGIGSIKIDERTNKVAITDYTHRMGEIEKIITAFDERTQQVLIDAQIIDIKPSNKFEMGVDWEYWLKQHFSISAALPMATVAEKIILSTATSTPTKPGDYKGVIEALRTIGDVKILSSPRIMVLNNQEAKILIGKKDAYITSTMSQAAGSTTVTSQSVNFVDTGIKLYVTPTINRDGFVTMKIKPEISTAEPKNILSEDKKTEIPIVETSETETTVMVKDGVTIIIGGLRKDERNRTEKRIPILGDIPLIGALFRNTSDDYQKRELVILLTPHIISGENSFTDFSEIKPREGAVFKMEKNEIVAENINSKIVSEALINYSETLNRNITRVAKRSLIKANGIKGEAALSFTLSAQGKLINGPEVISASDPVLVPLAIKAIKDAAPFPKFPTELGKLEETFRITLQY